MFFYLFILLLIIYLLNSFYIKSIKVIHKDEAKGPKIGLPIFGNLLQLGRISPQIELMKLESKYQGGLIRIWMGDSYCVFLYDVDLIRQVFIKNFETCSNRPKSPLIRIGTNEFRGINGSSNQCWLKNKNILVNAMKRANTKNIYSLLDNQVLELINIMNNTKHQNFNPKYYFRKLVLSTMFKYIFNETIEINENKRTVNELIDEIENIFKSVKIGKILNTIKILEIPYYYYLKYSDRVFTNIRSLIISKYKQHLQSIDLDIPKDLLDILINEYGRGDGSGNLNIKHTQDDILNISQVCLDILLSGSETTANTLEWMIIKLCNNPECQELAYQELNKVVSMDVNVANSTSTRQIILTDRPNTPYIQGIIKETMRMHPVVVFGLPRSSESDETIGNYFIPKQTKIFINYHSIGYNEKYFTHPYKFDPTRYNNSNGNGSNSNSNHIFFGLGARSCIGQQIANDQLYLCISNILLNFKLSPVNENEKINEDGIFGLTVCPNKFNIKLISR